MVLPHEGLQVRVKNDALGVEGWDDSGVTVLPAEPGAVLVRVCLLGDRPKRGSGFFSNERARNAGQISSAAPVDARHGLNRSCGHEAGCDTPQAGRDGGRDTHPPMARRGPGDDEPTGKGTFTALNQGRWGMRVYHC